MHVIPEIIKERFPKKELIIVPFDPEMMPINTAPNELQQIEHILLLDENGGKITTLLAGETVSDALKLLGENAKDVAFVLSVESGFISEILHV